MVFGASGAPGAGATSPPLSATVRGLPLPLSLRLTAAVRAPVAVGVKVTLIEQLAATASVAGLRGHVVVCAKPPAFVPVIARPLIVSAPGPLLVTVTASALLAASVL